MNKIKLCIFDMDGLLLDTERCIWFVGEKQLAKKYGKEMNDELSAQIMGMNRKAFIEFAREHLGNDFPAEQFSKELHEYYGEACKTQNIPLRPGAIELLDFLKNNNVLISLGTSTERKYAEIALTRSGIIKYFDYIVYGDQVKISKPNPEIFTRSVEHFNLNVDDCVVFEDSPIGAKAAYNGNIRLILVPDIKQPSVLDKEKAFAIINSLQEAIPLIKKINNIK